VRSIEECSWEPKILIPTQECAQERTSVDIVFWLDVMRYH